MRVLITWGSKHGGTTDIAEQIGHVLRERGHDVHARPAEVAPPPRGFHAVIIGGGLYANRWAAPARHYLEHHLVQLRHIPTWLFSSGPLDESADTLDLSPPREIRGLMARIGAVDHMTFGGRLEKNVKGLTARALAREHAGDWRNPDRIRAWAEEIADELPTARPRPVEPLHGRAIHRLVEYGTAGWAITVALGGLVLALATTHQAIIAHLVISPLVFGVLAHRYQTADGARKPLHAALVWTLMMLVLDILLISAFIRPQYVFGILAPELLVFFTSWVVGVITRMTPVPQPFRRATT